MGLVLWLGRALQGLRGWGKSPAQQSGGRWPRQMRQPEEASKARELARSASGFMLGMALASLYGALVLLAQGHNVWYCLVTTTSLGAGLGLGMAFSVKVRVTVLLSLPHIFTSKQLLVPLLEARGVPGGCQIPAEPQDPPVLAGEGKMLLLLLALGMAMQGPCTNILHNFSRAAESLSCGAELALNQTAERLQHAQEPLLNVLSKIKDIAQKAKVVGDHVRKFFRSIMDSVSHVGERGSPRVSPSPAPPHPAFSLSLSPLLAACPSTLAPCPQPEPCAMSGCGWRTWGECATTSWARRTAAACTSSTRPRTTVSAPSPSSSSSATSSSSSGPSVVWPMVSGSLSLCSRGGRWRGGPIPTTGGLPWQRPLLSAVALLFCIIPQYIQSFLKRKIGDPLRDALDRVHREFEFNISAVHRFDISLNASKSLGEVALDIMEGVHLRLEPIRQVLGLFMHVSFCAILYMYLQALRYRHRYLWDDTFDNVYITRRFVELDLWRAEQGKPTVLPLTGWESGRYIAPGQPHARGSIPQVSPAARSRGVPAPHGLTALHARPAGLWLSRQERRRYGLQLVGVLRHVLLGLSIVLADYSLFWLLDLVQHQLRGEIVARAPAVLGVSVNGTGYTSEIFRDLVSAFGVLQQGNISVLSQRCLLQPVEPDYSTYLSMGLLYGICLFIAVFGSYVARLRRAVCAAYYPCREQERTTFLHSTILARRAGLARALRQAAMQRTADAGQGNLLLFLTSRLPTFAWLVRLLGIQQKRCLACGMAEQPDFIACITPSCKGLYCSECYQTLTNICSVCMGPLSYRDTGDEEMDSSDEDTVVLWLGAVQALRGQEQGRLLQQHIRKVVGGRGGSRRLPPELAARLRAQLKEEASGESDGGSSGVDGEDSSLSSLDFSYQEQPESSGSELEEVMALQLPSSKGRAR
ncbi:DC-STAMP domain-containing protein 2 isoform X2 [Aquila chrysaetos chrysaetos]|uniref:DC-STAMP domain-containing protein 2 isoform X2 n=1 Tax=Aquila chrysaetos chrysaetos TaxID=223781 RepID=UPI001B7D3609|nr:DC-STAMP domain-containing protein 2 isoform X2 [Aquila chrysaetos chrysaetos]